MDILTEVTKQAFLLGVVIGVVLVLYPLVLIALFKKLK